MQINQLLPADMAAVGPPQPWSVTDIIDIATLVGGIFGKGGGSELANAALLQYLQQQVGVAAAKTVFTDLKEQNDPNSPTTTATSFPYGTPGKISPSTTAMPDNAAAPLTGGPTDTTPGCNLTSPSVPAMQTVASLLASLGHEHAVGGCCTCGFAIWLRSLGCKCYLRPRSRGRGRTPWIYLRCVWCQLPRHQLRRRAWARTQFRLVGDVGRDR